TDWEEYIGAKMNITKNQTADDYLIYNADQDILHQLAQSSKATLIPFSTKKYISEGVSIDNDKVIFMGEEIIHLADIALPGSHNLENILAAIAAVKIKGVSNESIHHVLSTFQGVKHRSQFIRKINGRK